MIVEMRTYTLEPGKTGEYWQHYVDGGLAAQDPRLRPHLIGYFQTETGPLNQIVHLWKYDDLAQRSELRAANYARANWDSHLRRIRPLMVRQETTFLSPSPVAGMCPVVGL